MHREEFEKADRCASCGVEIDVGTERGYAFGPDGVLCFACATRRGGVYDAVKDRWSTEPDLSGLPDERRPHR
jgi:hypothetical protein